MKNNKNPWLSLRMNFKWLSASVTKTKLYKAYLQTNFIIRREIASTVKHSTVKVQRIQKENIKKPIITRIRDLTKIMLLVVQRWFLPEIPDEIFIEILENENQIFIEILENEIFIAILKKNYPSIASILENELSEKNEILPPIENLEKIEILPPIEKIENKMPEKIEILPPIENKMPEKVENKNWLFVSVVIVVAIGVGVGYLGLDFMQSFHPESTKVDLIIDYLKSTKIMIDYLNTTKEEIIDYLKSYFKK